MSALRLLAAALLFVAAAAQAQVKPAGSDAARAAALVPLLELQDMIHAAKVTRAGMTAAQADAALKATASTWLRQPPTTTEAELLRALRDETESVLDYASLRVAAATRWPPDRPADVYKALANERLERLNAALRDAPTTRTALVDILEKAVEVIGWTEARPALDAAHNPFAGCYDRAVLAAVPSSAQMPGLNTPPPRPQAPPSALAPGKLASSPTPPAKPPQKPPPVGKPAIANPPPPVAAKPPPPLPPGTLKLTYFGLFDDRVGPRGLVASGRPDGRFVLTIDVGKLSSRELMYIGLQAMDANSRPVGPIWHTRDSARPLLLVVAGDQWLNTGHVGGLASLDGPEIDLILFADNAPEPTAVNAFIVEAGFADGSIARQLAKSR